MEDKFNELLLILLVQAIASSRSDLVTNIFAKKKNYILKIIKKVIKIKYVIFLVQNIFKKWLAVSQSAFDQFYFTYSTENTVKLNVKHCVRNFEKKGYFVVCKTA